MLRLQLAGVEGGVVVRVDGEAESGDGHVEVALLDRLVEHLEVSRVRCQLDPDRLQLVGDDRGGLDALRLAGAHPDLADELLRGAPIRVGSGRHAVGPDGPSGLRHQ